MPRRALGRKSICRACDRAKSRAYYLANRERKSAAANERDRRLRALQAEASALDVVGQKGGPQLREPVGVALVVESEQDGVAIGDFESDLVGACFDRVAEPVCETGVVSSSVAAISSASSWSTVRPARLSGIGSELVRVGTWAHLTRRISTKNWKAITTATTITKTAYPARCRVEDELAEKQADQASNRTVHPRVAETFVDRVQRRLAGVIQFPYDPVARQHSPEGIEGCE